MRHELHEFSQIEFVFLREIRVQNLCALAPLWLRFFREAVRHPYLQADRRPRVALARLFGSAAMEAARSSVRAVRLRVRQDEHRVLRVRQAGRAGHGNAGVCVFVFTSLPPQATSKIKGSARRRLFMLFFIETVFNFFRHKDAKRHKVGIKSATLLLLSTHRNIDR